MVALGDVGVVVEFESLVWGSRWRLGIRSFSRWIGF